MEGMVDGAEYPPDVAGRVEEEAEGGPPGCNAPGRGGLAAAAFEGSIPLAGWMLKVGGADGVEWAYAC